MKEKNREIILDTATLQGRIKELGRIISQDYAGKNLVVIGVLKGAFIFMADLVRVLDVPLALDFIQVSSYGKGSSSSEEIILKSAPTIDLAGRDVLLVEDIVDSGLTIQWLRDHLACQGANSVKVCALIDKGERRAHPVHIDYCGFFIPQGFLVGYGLDLNEQYRSLPAIYHLQSLT
jgi:hypoxanthine phosphoribosyltransferase